MSTLYLVIDTGGAESCTLGGRSSLSNGGRSKCSTAAGFSIESEEEQYAEDKCKDKCRGVIVEPISLEICTTTTTV